MSYYIRSFQEMKKKRKPFFWFYFSFFCIFMKFPNYFSQQFRFFDSKRTKWRTHKSKLQMPNAKDCDRHKKKILRKATISDSITNIKENVVYGPPHPIHFYWQHSIWWRRNFHFYWHHSRLVFCSLKQLHLGGCNERRVLFLQFTH